MVTEAARASHVKGAAFAEFLRWYLEHYDPEPVRSALALVPVEQRAGLAPDAPLMGVLVSTWYPSPLVHSVLDLLGNVHSANECRTMVHEATQAAVERMFRGLYAVLFNMLATPPRYARHIQRAWRQLHDTGEREVQLTGATEALSITRAWAGHHPLLCDVTLETMGAVFERMGCKQVQVSRLQCIARGADDCRARLRWTA